MENENDSWFEDDELVRELLDDETPFFVLPAESTDEANKYSSPSNNEDDRATLNRVASAVYSGPTIEDIDNALSVATGKEQYSQAISKARFIHLLFFNLIILYMIPGLSYFIRSMDFNYFLSAESHYLKAVSARLRTSIL